MMRYYIDCYM